MKSDLFMLRCFDLARLGAGNVSPNPMVGAVLVHEDRIIGEGYHKKYGGAHAEVNAVANVSPIDRHLIPLSTLYVSLEPCCIFGRTPPCTRLIIDQKIPSVVVSTIDHTAEVAGQGIKLLKNAGVQVEVGLLEEEGKALASIRNTFVTHHRPYILLKYAQTTNGILAPNPPRSFWITNPLIKRLVHRWRSEIDSIMVGTNTALVDNPQLNNRLYFGPSPVRIVVDQHQKLGPQLHLLDGKTPSIVFTKGGSEKEDRENLSYVGLDFTKNILPQILEYLAQKKYTSLMVEGGSSLLQSFVDAGLWDEALVLVGKATLKNGLPAPQLNGRLMAAYSLDGDQIRVYQNH